MYPELVRIGDFAITSFGAMMVVAFLAAYFQAAWGMKRAGAGDADDASALVFAAGVGGIVGGKLYYAALYADWRTLFDRAGLVWYGGMIGGALCVMWVIRRRRLPFVGVADAVLPGVALGYAIGRIGCFLVGDDYGLPTDSPLGVVFPQGLPPATAGTFRHEYGLEMPAALPDDALVPVHPTQLYETTMALAIWAVGAMMLRRGARRGATALTVAALLAVERFVVEIFRAKDDRFFGQLTLAQVISVILLALVAGLWWAWRRRGAARAAAASPGGAPP
ncbi:MAG TPA: prolipoprotein diacylglyceryl transferase family protein [Thermoanaerobaculia bacterium]|nr:prolipoprotein diacylglyceryl transferase family protein [Thermoanaerobaculia bacterium]